MRGGRRGGGGLVAHAATGDGETSPGVGGEEARLCGWSDYVHFKLFVDAGSSIELSIILERRMAETAPVSNRGPDVALRPPVGLSVKIGRTPHLGIPRTGAASSWHYGEQTDEPLRRKILGCSA